MTASVEDKPEQPKPPSLGYLTVADRLPNLIEGDPDPGRPCSGRTEPVTFPKTGGAPCLHVIGHDGIVCRFFPDERYLGASTVGALTMDPRVRRAWVGSA